MGEFYWMVKTLDAGRQAMKIELWAPGRIRPSGRAGRENRPVKAPKTPVAGRLQG
ncbi:hypothetical protein [Thermopirellula anaerolimosa]